MILKKLDANLTICKTEDLPEIAMSSDIFFLGKTDEEISLVCRTEAVPARTLEREDGWKGFRIEGKLDFSLTGILARISGILAENEIGIFAVSTFNTDYILVKRENFSRVLDALAKTGYEIQD